MAHPDKRYGIACPALAFYRGNRQMSQAQLARKAGLHVSTVFNIEQGGRARLATMQKLSQALRLDSPAVLTLPPPEPRQPRHAHYAPPLPPITRRPELDLAAVDPLRWHPSMPASVLVFAERAERARMRRDARLELERRTRSRREPWA